MTTPPTKTSSFREPGAIVFADTTAQAPRPVAPATPVTKTNTNGPSAIEFGLSPSQATPSPLAKPAPVSEGPRPIVFADTPHAPVRQHEASPEQQTPQHRVSAPKAVSFGPERSAPSPVPRLAAPQHYHVAATPVLVAAPSHPLASTLMAQCMKQQTLNTTEQSVLARFLSQLLPFSLEVVENYGQRNLESCRKHAVAATQENHLYSQLAVSERLQEVLSLSLPSSNLMDRLRSKIKNTVNPGSHNIPMLRSMIEDFLRRNRAMQTDFVDDKLRLELAAMALKATVRELRLDDNPPLERAAHHRLTLMEASVMQARLVTAQLQGLEQMASSHLIECDRVSTVTLSAANMANQLKY